MRLRILKVSVCVLSFVVFQTGSCMSGGALRVARAARQSAKCDEPRYIPIQRAVDVLYGKVSDSMISVDVEDPGF